MRFNTAGSAAYGTTAISIDGLAVATLSGVTADRPSWLSTTEIAYQNQTAGNIFQKYNTGSHALTTLSATGANISASGGGIWAKFLTSTGVVTGTSGLGPFPSSALLATGGDVTGASVDELGNLVIIVNYQAGSGLRAYDVSGTQTMSLQAALSTSIGAVRSGLLAYKDAAGWHLQPVGVGTASFGPRTGETVNLIIPALNGTTAYVLERSERLTFRASTSATGWVIASTPTTFQPDAVWLTSAVVRLGWCTSTGEGTATLRLVDLNVTTNQMRTGAPSGGVIVWGAWTAVASSSLPIGPVVTSAGGNSSGTGITALQRQPVLQTGTNGLMSKPWYDWAVAVSKVSGAPVNLSNATGVLPVQNGGTGSTTGGSDIVPMQVQFSQTQVLAGRNTAGAGDGEEVTISQALDWLGT